LFLISTSTPARCFGVVDEGICFDVRLPKSPLIPLFKRGKTDIGPPLCKGETEGISQE
jgi:hypothetical protein